MIENAIIIFSRLDSKRLPNKAFLALGGIPLIEWTVSTFKENNFGTVILATTNRDIDKPLVEYAERQGVKYFQGAVDNVAKRLVDCLEKYNINNFARINADSPFTNSKFISKGFKKLKEKPYDFVTNLVPRTFPYGLSLEVFNSNFYVKEYKKFSTNDHFEHVTKYFYENIEKYNSYKFTLNKNFHNIRLTVDTEEDLDRLNKLVKLHPLIKSYSLENLILAHKTIFPYD